MPPAKSNSTIAPTHPALDTYYATLTALRTQKVAAEGGLRRAFGTLLSAIAAPKKWTLVEEYAAHVNGHTIYYDGVLSDEWGLIHGRWEAKDGKDDLDKEIRLKRGKGYDFDNMIFEDTRTAVLFQDKLEVTRVPISDRDALAKLLTDFLNYEVEPFTKFIDAVSHFQSHIADIAKGLKARIDHAHGDNRAFKTAYDDFFALCQSALNPNISTAAVDEMLIQHMLTERLISKLFMEEFTQRNIIASKVETVIAALASISFDRVQFLGSLDRFYTAIEDAADRLAKSSEKQAFINTVYEKFFQGYSVKTADTHGIVYTPQPIVDFMCASVEEVLKDEFGLDLGEEGVTVLDPATGTGNFVVHLLNRVDERYLRDFYAKQLFANEVMLMPYYIAALNIERAFYDRAKKYQPFEGLCFVDTLDMQTGVGQLGLFNEANTERVTRQNAAPITVIIGNPPYNSKQLNENDNNKNRKYDVVDKRIRETYVKDSDASLLTKIYDMYTRFFRWAIDRLGGNDGIVCYVTNNSFVDQIAFDGFRKHLLNDFTRVYHLDLHGNVRQNPKLSGTTHNVFGIQVGVGITVAIRSSQHTDRKLFYHRVPELWTKTEKLDFLRHHVELQGAKNILNTITWQEIKPNKKNNWLQPDDVELWESFLSIGSKESKRGKSEAIFKSFSLGVSTNRDNVVFDFDKTSLSQRIINFIEIYNTEIDRYKRQTTLVRIDYFVDYSKIKWSSTLKSHLQNQRFALYQPSLIRKSIYRPFTASFLYYDGTIVDRPGLFKAIFPDSKGESENRIICFSGLGHDR
ncbi:MAG TPA: type ISP restriction/modification enzyme, partial [Phototrophicaceae bacterium]|nr:type ISP restriction/modification enzyme [Phototrophicaceae bacterium]